MSWSERRSGRFGIVAEGLREVRVVAGVVDAVEARQEVLRDELVVENLGVAVEGVRVALRRGGVADQVRQVRVDEVGAAQDDLVARVGVPLIVPMTST